MLREKSRGGPILELAHSIVHSERDSGLFFRRMKENRDVLNNFGKKTGIVRGGDIFSSDDFAQNLNDTFVRYGFTSLSRPINDLIFLCSLSLLQGSSAKLDKKFGELSLILTSERFELHATIPFDYQDKEIRAAFPIASIVNRWIPICNPRAPIMAQGTVRVSVVNSLPVIEGFKPFEVHFERDPPIAYSEVRALAAQLSLDEIGGEIIYTPANNLPMALRYDNGKLTLTGLPVFFKPGSDYEHVLKSVKRILSACVHDDSGAHWFLEGLEIAPDGFHCHWVGRASATCTRPL